MIAEFLLVVIHLNIKENSFGGSKVEMVCQVSI